MVSVSSSAWRRMRGEKHDRAAERVAGVRQAVAAERGHQGPSRSQTAPSAARARSISAGSMLGVLGEGDQQRLVAEEYGRARRDRNCGRGRRRGSRRGRRRWRRGSRRGAPARRRGKTAPRRRAPSAASRRARSLLLRILVAFHGEAPTLLPASLAILADEFRKIGCELVTVFNRRCYAECTAAADTAPQRNFIDLSGC